MDNPAYDWFSDRYQSVVVSRNRWLVATLAAMTLAVLQAIALITLLPLKTSVPFIVQEERTGAISTIEPITGNSTIIFDEAVKKYFLGRYIVMRETFDPTDRRTNTRAVALLSDTSEIRRFEKAVLYTNRPRRCIRIKSISFLGPNAAQVRFSANEATPNGVENLSYWIATLGFRFGPPPVFESERLINPLGFLVTNYRIDQVVVQ
jgi:type IV secretion system protein VirB8